MVAKKPGEGTLGVVRSELKHDTPSKTCLDINLNQALRLVAVCDQLSDEVMREPSSLVIVNRIDRAILLIRGEKVMLDSDLASIYGVTTKRLNEQVKRNPGRFPSDFMFQLTEEEKAEVVAKCDHLARLKFSPFLPYAFTEHGALMLANVLNSDEAVKASVQVARAFVRLRRLLISTPELARKLDALEKKYDVQFKVLFEAIRELMAPPEAKRKEIGFRAKGEKK
jgi:hypothetical protein